MSRFYVPPIPNGWFQVGYSEDLKPGGVFPLKYFGRDLVLFRTEEGEAKVLDAFCPHLGAHLGYGGKVCGSAIQCPFHAWKFDGDGRCTEVPYAKKIPPKAKMNAWPVREMAGLIIAWNHTGGEAPSWEPAPVAEYQSPEWTPYEKRRWTVRSRNQDMAENAVDSAHFHYLHGTTNMPASQLELRGHIMRVYSDAGMETPRGHVDGSVESLSFGFGLSQVRFKGIVETLLLGCVTPIDGENVEVRFSFSIKKVGGADVIRGVGAAFIAEVSRQLEQDIPIWENKVQWENPVLCDGDGPVGPFRKWCRQFYTAAESPAVAESAAE